MAASEVSVVVPTAVLALAIGLLFGWSLARMHGSAAGRQAVVEAAALRSTLQAERLAAQQRENLLLQQADVSRLLRPLSDSLNQVGRQLGEVEKGRANSDAALREQVLAMSRTSEFLSSQTAALVTALRAPQVRGRWGEVQLERIVEAAGLTEQVDYVTQPSVTGDAGTVRPDLVVRLTGGRNVVVDAKVACSAYLEAMEAADEAARDDRLRAHARQLRAHIDALSAKAYWERFAPTPEFVVCFVPADTFLDAALRQDPELLEHAFGANVVLATPSTLIALLRTIAYGWRQESLATNAREVHELGRELYKRLATLGGHFERLGRSLASAVGTYNEAIGSMERMVLPKARQFADLGVVDPHQRLGRLEPIEPLNTAVVRPLAAPEFVDSRVVALGHPPGHPQGDFQGHRAGEDERSAGHG